MRITIITQYFLPEMGAPQNRLFELAKGLQQKGWSVNVVTAMPNYPTGKIFNGYRNKLSYVDAVENIPVKRYWLYASNSPKAIPRIISMLSFSFTTLLSLFYIRKSKPDFILVESPPLTLGFSAWLLSRFSRAGLIMNVSDLWPLSAKELGAISDGRLYSLIEKLEHFLYRKAKICTGQSEEIVEYIKTRTKSAVYLFRNGVDTTRFTCDPRQHGTQDHIKVVYAGLLGVAQGIFNLCSAVDFKSAGIEFHIYGTGAELKMIEGYLRANPDRGIKYCGIIPRDEMPKTLMQYDATIIALVKNIYGAVPSKIYEAMAAGLPIFFSGEGEGARIVDHNKVGWINKAGDWSKLSSNLAHFSTMDRDARNRISENCRKIAREKFDRNLQIENFHHYLKQTLTNS